MIFTYTNIFIGHQSEFITPIVVFTCALTFLKINNTTNSYDSTKYLVLFLLSLGLVFVQLNINNLLPVFYLLELGTITFILLTIKSNGSLFYSKNKKNVVIALLIPITTVLVLPNTYQKQSSIFLDLFKTTPTDNEFVALFIPVILTNTSTLIALLFFIFLMTFITIFFKNTLSSVQTSRPNGVDIFQKVRNIFYFTKKNIVCFFKPN